MGFYTKLHKFYCGIDLHARTMSVCILTCAGEILVHRELKAASEPFLKAMAPYRENVVVGVKGVFTWSWLADLWAREGMPCVRGHALYMKAIHGGTATHDRIDAHKLAVRLRGGLLPQASVYPAGMRATRDLLRRRRHLMRHRAGLLAHLQKTNSQSNLPLLGKKLADKANREGVAERFADPAVQQRIAVDLTLIGSYDRLLTELELDIVHTAKAHEAHPVYRLRSIPGVSTILALVRLYELHDIHRFPRGQAVASYGRLVKCAKESAGKRSGTAGAKIGNAYLQWAFSEAAVRLLRNNPAGPTYLARLAKPHGKGTALTVLAHKLGRAVSYMCTRDTAFALDPCLHASWSGAGEPAAYLAAAGISLTIACWQP